MAYQSEIEKLEQRYEENPKQWFAALADAYRKEGRLDLALEYVRGGLEMRPNYASGQIVLGRCLLEKKEYEEASQAFQQVLELDAENIIALKSLSEISESKGDLGGARHWLTRLLEIDPMNDEAVQSLERLDRLPQPEEVAPEAEAEQAAGPALEPGAAWAKEAMAGQAPAGSPEAAPEEPVSEPAQQMVPEEAAWTPGEEPVLPDEAAAGAGDGDFVIERYSGENVFGAETLGAEPGTEAAEAEEPWAEASSGEEPSAVAEEVAELSLTGEPSAGALDEEPTAEVPQVDIEVLGDRDRADAQHREEAEAEGAPTVTEEAAAGAALAPAGEVPEEGAEDAARLDVMSFDEELGWDAGERLSRSISASDIVQADAQHEDLAAPVEFLGDPEAVEARRASAAGRTPEPEPAEEALRVEPAEAVEEPQAPGWSQPEAELEVTAETTAEAAGFVAEPRRDEAEVGDVEGLQPEGAGVAEGAEESALVDDRAEPGTVEAYGAMGAGLEPELQEEGSEYASVDLPLIMPEEDQQAALGPVEPEPVVTETMAEVYAKQGLFEQARQTYDQLLEQRPGDAELERRRDDVAERAKAAAVAKQVSPYSVAATGGPSVVAYLRGVFGGASEEEIFRDATVGASPPVEPESGGLETAPPDEGPISALESAFQRDDAEPLGAPTRPAGDEVSLKSVFGGERSPIRPTPVEPTPEPEQPHPPDGVSFDEFYGKRKPEPVEEGDAEGGGRNRTDEDFKNWLEGLKT